MSNHNIYFVAIDSRGGNRHLSRESRYRAKRRTTTKYTKYTKRNNQARLDLDYEIAFRIFRG